MVSAVGGEGFVGWAAVEIKKEGGRFENEKLEHQKKKDMVVFGGFVVCHV